MLQKIATACLFILLGSISVYSQTQLKTLPTNINRPSVNLWAPFVSGDGQTLIYLTDYTDDGHHAMNWATKKTVSTWNDGQLVNRLINRPTLNFRGGYSLSFDGDQLFFTSLKSGLGGFDIWSSKRNGNDWSAPKNMGLPINSRAHDGSPFLSPDGELLFFMRCEQMKTYGGASDCKLMVSKITYNGWEEPIELPPNINTGNSQTPRLLADGETLIFSSDKMGGKGGLDLFMSKKEGKNTWSDPIAMTFANTEGDDSFVSIPAKGRYMYKDVAGPRENQLVEILIPDEFQPESVMRVQGRVTDEAGSPVNAQLTIFDIDNRDRLWNEKIGAKGDFAIVLKEGAAYDLSVDNGDPAYMYYAKTYDLNSIGSRDKERLNIKLRPLERGEEYSLDILFEPLASEIQEISTYEMRRLGDFIRKNTSLQVEIQVHQTHYQEDTIQSHPDLTEIRIDTMYLERPYVESGLIPLKYDSLFNHIRPIWEALEITIDSINYQVELTDDSLFVKEFRIASLEENNTDSLGSDSLALISPPPIVIDTLNSSFPLTKFETTKFFHNDRTPTQCNAIEEFLIDRGVKPSQIKVAGYRQEQSLPEDETEQTVKTKMKVLRL